MNTGTLVTGEVQTDPLAAATFDPTVSGVSYLYDIQPGADLMVTLPRHTPVQLCDLAATPSPTSSRHDRIRHGR